MEISPRDATSYKALESLDGTSLFKPLRLCVCLAVSRPRKKESNVKCKRSKQTLSLNPAVDRLLSKLNHKSILSALDSVPN